MNTSVNSWWGSSGQENTIQTYFAIGLRSLVKALDMKQSEFCEGICSPQNLSKVLNNKSGTSEEMRLALARRLEKSVDEIITIGENIMTGVKDDTRKPHTVVPFHDYQEKKHYSNIEEKDDVGEKKFDSFCSAMSDKISATVKEMSERGKELLAELNAYKREAKRLESVLNSVGESIKVINRNYVVTYCNQAHIYMGGAHIGERCKDANCDSSRCIARIVFDTGKSTHLHKEFKDEIYSVIGYPIYGETGRVDSVVIVGRPISNMSNKEYEVIKNIMDERMRQE